MLEDEKADWENLVLRLDKLSSFGSEPVVWVKLLRPIFRCFVQAFDGDPDIDFWSRVCHHQSFGSGPVYLSGWITAFCVWSIKEKWQGPPLDLIQPPPQTHGTTGSCVKDAGAGHPGYTIHPTISKDSITIKGEKSLE